MQVTDDPAGDGERAAVLLLGAVALMLWLVVIGARPQSITQMSVADVTV